VVELAKKTTTVEDINDTTEFVIVSSESRTVACSAEVTNDVGQVHFANYMVTNTKMILFILSLRAR